MAQYQNRLEELLAKYSENKVNEAEFNELCDLVNTSGNEAAIKAKLISDLQQAPITQLEKNRLDKILNKVLQNKEAPVYAMHNRKSFAWTRIAAAAVVILLLSIGGYFYFSNDSHKQIAGSTKQPSKNDVAPGGNKAILTLADKTQIVLDSANNGVLTQQGNTKVIKLDDGQLAYNAANENGEVLYNIITTPKGGQYQIVLSDGSKVWLNAASSVKFPTSFTGKERNVELTGEGYFEVAKNASMPFNVTVGEMKVQVLGTHFNINAYNDEAAIKTTLLEGSVKVQSIVNGQSAILKPGQQAQLQTINNTFQTINNVDIYSVMAWKDGFFEFEKMELPAIMRQIERWYNVSIEYKHPAGKERFGGRISRYLNLSNVLKLLEASGVRFRLQENKIVVL